jgi:hypothetical protein
LVKGPLSAKNYAWGKSTPLLRIVAAWVRKERTVDSATR